MKTSQHSLTTNSKTRKLNWAIPEALGVPPDQLQFRLDFYHDSIVATQVEGKKKTTKLV